jgi:hypothetical protein
MPTAWWKRKWRGFWAAFRQRQAPGTPQQSIDAISAAFNDKSDLRRFLGIYEAASELGKDDIAAALERAKAEDNPIAVRALERRWAEVDPVGAIKARKEGKAQPFGDAFSPPGPNPIRPAHCVGSLRWMRVTLKLRHAL